MYMPYRGVHLHVARVGLDDGLAAGADQGVHHMARVEEAGQAAPRMVGQLAIHQGQLSLNTLTRVTSMFL